MKHFILFLILVGCTSQEAKQSQLHKVIEPCKKLGQLVGADIAVAYDTIEFGELTAICEIRASKETYIWFRNEEAQGAVRGIIEFNNKDKRKY